MKQTLESIQKNLDKATGNDSSSDDSDDEDEEIADEDSSDGEDITQDVATDELGPDVIESSTEDPNLAQDTGMNDSGSESSDSSTEDNMGIPEATEDGTQDTAAETPEEGESEDTTDEMMEIQTFRRQPAMKRPVQMDLTMRRQNPAKAQTLLMRLQKRELKVQQMTH